MDAGTRVADLGAGGGGRPVLESGGGHGAAHGLCDHLVGLEVEVLARAEALDRGVDQPRVDLTKPFPRKAEPIDDAGSEVLGQDVDPDTRSVKMRLPSSLFMLTVMLRLLQLSIVK